ncbi:hypothetical protein [Streptomyces sp. NPDC005009]
MTRGSLVADQWTFNHGGGNPLGISTAIEIHPETDTSVVVLSNHEGTAVQSSTGLARKLITA